MTTEDRGRQLEWTGERYLPGIAGNIRLEHVHRYLLAQELCKGRRVLDIACGEGYGSDLLARVALDVIGVDIDTAVVRHAHATYSRPNLTFVAGTCAAFPLADRSVDVVVSFETLEHHDQHDAMMREIKRVLRPDGLLIISSPDRREYSDVPNYRNPFHVRELYRDEFTQLLSAHFQHVGLIGQRVRAGSIVGPLDEVVPTTFVTFGSTDDEGRTEGLHAPLYLIGIATDGTMPQVATGLLDGGDFSWPEDYRAAVQALADGHEHDVDLLSAQASGSLKALQAELDRQLAMIATLAAGKGKAEERTAWLEADIAQRAQRLDEITRELVDVQRERHELGMLSRDAHHALDNTRLQLSTRDRELADVRATLDTVRARLRRVEARLSAHRELELERQTLAEQAQALQRELEQARDNYSELRTAFGQLEGHRAALTQTVGIMEQSSSWRVTSPLRASRRLMSHAPAVTRRVISDSMRSVYRALPVPRTAKTRIKGAVFRTAPWLVRHTVAYRAWLEQHRPVVTPAPVPPTLALEPEPEVAPAPSSASRLANNPEYVPITTTPDVTTNIKAIAFYVPQFYPTPETDQWWGQGFTDWRDVARGRPRFPGHLQPHVPGELGFYDLRLLDVQRRQIELARMYGLYGFCYQHYWFNGTRLLRQPLDQLLANPDLDFPFCLCWANESWTRGGVNTPHQILIAQRHSPEDDLAFIQDVEPALRDRRYIRFAGRPVLMVYQPSLLPDARATAERWRRYWHDAGLGDLYLVAGQVSDARDPQEFGFDAALALAPNETVVSRMAPSIAPNPDCASTIYEYRDLVTASQSDRPAGYVRLPCVAPMWDNDARQPGTGVVFANSSPALYGEWLERACQDALEQPSSVEKSVVFINAWNDWAQGAHLEPDRHFGYAYLQATADAVRKFPAIDTRPSIVVVSHDALFFGAQRVALTLARTLSESLGYRVEILLCGDGPLAADFANAGQVHDFFSAASTPEVRQRIVRELYEQGARVALCNTSCLGEVVHLLRESGFGVVSMIHELPNVIREYGLEESSNQIAREATRVVFPARIVRDRFIELTQMAPQKAVVRPQGLLAKNAYEGRRAEARRELRGRLGLSDATKIVLAVAPASLRKGIDLFVDAGLRVVAAMEDVVFVWVGNRWGVRSADEFEEAHGRITAAGMQSRFIFPGLIENPDVFFAGADVYLMSSREDPFPLVVLDALVAEVPVIGFEDAGGFGELLRRDCGILVPYLDTPAMAAATLRLLGDNAEARRLATNGKTIMDREFAFVDYARDLVQLAQGPRVSVIVPNYNYERYLPARLQSILSQRYRPHEILFLDDCSSDRSVARAESILAASGIPYRIIRNATNQGVYRQWMRGLREATGDLVWIAEADDECAPTFLETLVPALANPGVVLAYCQSKQIDGEGHEIAPDYLQWTEDVDPAKWRSAYLRRGTDEIRDSLIVKNTIPNVSAVVMRKPDLSGVQTELESLRHAGDWLVYVHLLERGDLAFVPEALNAHRRHSGSVTIGQGGVNLMREILLVQRDILSRHPVTPEVERKREASLQTTYEYLGLHTNGPATYRDHPALNSLTALAG
jgi:O-antigen biosynthesis protein